VATSDRWARQRSRAAPLRACRGRRHAGRDLDANNRGPRCLRGVRHPAHRCARQPADVSQLGRMARPPGCACDTSAQAARARAGGVGRVGSDGSRRADRLERSFAGSRALPPGGGGSAPLATLWEGPRRSNRRCARPELRSRIRARRCRENVPRKIVEEPILLDAVRERISEGLATNQSRLEG
jgi:hypothetical protein